MTIPSNLVLTRQSLTTKLSCHAIHRLTTIVNTRHELLFQGASGGGKGSWACGEGEQEKESLNAQEHGRQPFRLS
eukprot:1157975-Pelagomonas_calceolata.AAC.7